MAVIVVVAEEDRVVDTAVARVESVVVVDREDVVAEEEATRVVVAPVVAPVPTTPWPRSRSRCAA